MTSNSISGSATFVIVSMVIDSAIRGYRVYQDIWPSPVVERLLCKREVGNSLDPMSVAVKSECF